MPTKRFGNLLLSVTTLVAFFLSLSYAAAGASSAAYVRVSQIGYESANAPFQAYLMATASEAGATFTVTNSSGAVEYSGSVGAQTGTWTGGSATYDIYSLSFTVSAGTYTISVTGPVAATSPKFAVNTPAVLYPGLLLNTLWFFDTEMDGPNYIPNALRTAAGHLNDASATVYDTPPLNTKDLITTSGTPLSSTGTTINGEGGWWDAGDYMKYVETISYTVAMMEIGLRDFPNQMGPGAPASPPAPPVSVSYSGNAAGAPTSSNFTAAAQFGINFLEEMWNDSTKSLYYQVDNSQDWKSFKANRTEYDIWTLPQAADDYDSCTTDYEYICHRPVFIAGTAGSTISPNLAGRLAAAFAEYYQLYHTSNPTAAAAALLYAEDIFALANTSYPDPAPSVNDGSCSTCLFTAVPFDGYPETVWDDDMELGATELYIALEAGGSSLPSGLPVTSPTTYLNDAATYANNYTSKIYGGGHSNVLNLYDVSSFAHFELYRALGLAGNPSGLAVNQSTLLTALENQLSTNITQAGKDAWGFGVAWNQWDTASFGDGLSVIASELYYLTGTSSYNTYAQHWLANVLGANAWGVSFIVGDGTTFPNCLQHQVANLAGALNGSSGGTPVLWGAVVEGPNSAATKGSVTGMVSCPTNGTDTYAIFTGNDSGASGTAQFQDNMQSYSNTEPAIDLTASSFLAFSWRLAGTPEALP